MRRTHSSLVLTAAILSYLLPILQAELRGVTEQNYWYNLAKEELQLNKQRFKVVDTEAKAKNVILFIGDGLSIPTLTAARTLKAQLRGELPGHPRLYFEEFPFVGLSQTYNTDKLGPDSAATATAYLCGVKAQMGVIGVDERVQYGNCSSYLAFPDSDLKCIGQISMEAGKSVGLVTTKSITDASPAPMYAHSPERDWHSDKEMNEADIQKGCVDIAAQLIQNYKNVHVVLGGGLSYFNSSYRRDKRDLVTEWLNLKMNDGRKPAYVKTLDELKAINASGIDDVLGLFADSSLKFDQERNQTGSNQPSLTDMALKALEIVQNNPKGFFLFIEGGKIDSAHHNNNAGHALYETLAFEKAIEAVLSKVDVNETLVLVTADHSHVFTFGSYVSRTNFVLDPTDSSKDDRNQTFTSLLYGNGPGFAIRNDGMRPVITSNDTDSLTYRYEAAVPMDSETHGCDEVAVYAIGPQSYLVHSLLEQSTLAHLMMYSSCIGPHANSSHCPPDTSSAAKHEPIALLLFALMLVVLHRMKN